MPPKKAATPAAKGKAPAKPAAKAKKAAAPAAGGKGGKGGAAAAAPPPPPPVAAPPMGTTVSLKAFGNFIFDTNPESEVKKSGRWPVISDESERATTFLRYRDVNMLNVMSPAEMAVDRIRLALVGGIRFGKPMVIDMMTADFAVHYPRLVEAVEAVGSGLMKEILSKDILKEEVYQKYIKESDGADYKSHLFDDRYSSNFCFVLAAGTKDFPPEVVQNYYIATVE